MPSRLLFPRIVSAQFQFFGWAGGAGNGCSFILSNGIVNSRLFLLGSLAAIAPFQPFSVLCIFPHVSHFGCVGHLYLFRCFLLCFRDNGPSCVSCIIPYSVHICRSGNNGRVVVGPLSHPVELHRLRSEGLTLFQRALLDAERCHCRAYLQDMPY